MNKPTVMRKGVSLLELIVTMALMGFIITSVSTLLRTSLATWDTYDSDSQKIEAAHATVRHVVRQLRQGRSITAIVNANAGNSLHVLMSNGQNVRWVRRGTDIRYEVDGTVGLLSAPIDDISFVGLTAAGTVTTDVDLMRAVQVTCTVILDPDTGQNRVIRSTAWLRTR